MSKKITLGETFHAVHELVGDAIVCEGSLFIGNILLATNGDHLRAYKLRDEIPVSLTASLDHPIYNATFLDYLHAAQNKGIASPMGAIFSKENYHIDCEEIELDGHNFQPKLDVLTQRLDDLDLVNALDSEVVAAFVTQLAAGGDAFQLVESKVAVETSRATSAEGVNASAIAQEILDRDDAVTAEATARGTAVAVVQGAVDAVEVILGNRTADQIARVDATSSIQDQLNAEASARGSAVAGVQAAVDAVELILGNRTADQIARVDATSSIQDQLNAEATARAQAIATEVIDRNAAISTAVANLIDSAPGALDTLNELAAAMGDDASFSASVTNSLAGKQPLDAHLTSVVTAGRTVQQLESLDTTSAISGLLAAKQNQLTHGIANGNTVQISAADVASGEFARFSASGLESRTAAEVKAELAVSKADVALGNVENTALSSWGGSANVIQVGAVASGTWQGTPVADSYVASAATWNAKQNQLTHGIANGNTVQISAADVASGEFARFSASGLESRTAAEVKAELAVSKADVALGNVENTALSSWGGSSNVIQVGAVASGTWQGTAVADSYVASAATWNAKQNQLTHGIANGNTVQISAADVASGEFARFSASGLESRTAAEVKAELAVSKADVALGNVENTALSTWGGSSNVIQVGAVASGTWQGTAVADSYVASAATWNAKQIALTAPELAVIGANAFTNAYKQEVDDNTDKISYSAAASAQVAANAAVIATKAADSDVVKKTGSQTIDQDGSGAVLQLRNNTGDQKILTCWGADGQTQLSGGNVIQFTRNGNSAIRAPESAAAVQVQVRGSTLMTASDALHCSGDVVLEKAVPGSETASGIVGSIRVDATHIYVCTATDTWKKVALVTF